ncbi:hypothetical protein EB796_000849 [Bugula neritina]|uniref:Ubiquitin-like domain-containing protein n=1 Tax=Bugula neritina TaxID=10212 RepID=A0A7J7KRN7_BUGNE|nr:hypothetical protein EB796_000849 [Bugula neritina]
MDTSSKEGQTRMIHVQTETKNLDLSVDLACNVQGLKESIEEVEGIPVQQQEIILNGKELNHGEDLPQQDELTLQLVVKSDSNVEESAAGNFSTEAAEEEYTEADFEDSTSLDKVDSANQDIKEKDKETASVNTGLDSPNPQKAGSPISVAFLDDGVDSLISDHYQTLTDMLSKRVEELTSGHFKSYTQLSVLQQTANHISSHMKHNEDFLLKMSKALEITMNSLSKLNKTIINKIEEEHLQTWLSTPITSQDASEQSKSRDLMAKAAELREAVAASELQFAAVTKLCAEMEVNTAEAQQMAIDARIAAEEAARKVEEAEKAAREKHVIIFCFVFIYYVIIFCFVFIYYVIIFCFGFI